MSIVTVDLAAHPSNIPLGILLAPACPSYTATPTESTLVILAGWERIELPDENVAQDDAGGNVHDDDGGSTKNNKKGSSRGGRLGPIQRTGQVRLGDRLVRINNVDVTKKTFRQVMDLLKSMLYPDENKKPPAAAGTRSRSTGTKKNPSGGGAIPKLQSISFEAVPAAGPVGLQHERQLMQQQQSGGSGGAIAGFGGGESSPLFDTSQSPTRGSSGGFGPLHNSSAGKLYSFMSSVRRARIHNPTEELEETDDGGDDGPYVEYEVVCYLTVRSYGRFTSGLSAGPGGAGSGEEIVWSVWRRYSAFKELDAKLRKSHGWQIDALNDSWGLRFPSGHAVQAWIIGNQDPGFVESRRAELESYWQSLQHIDDAFDLNPTSQKYSRDVAAFLDVERYLPRIRSHLNLHSGGSVASGGMHLDGLGEGGVNLLGAYSPTTHADDEDNLPRRNNELLNIVLSGNSALDTSMLSSHSTPGKRKKRIPGAAKSAFQRSPLDDM
mmetsp:Transcript_2406/g.5117  ORF Transcript_2406/g.5117 Transcript_2406/m.5117 type:complete len:494 (-) Transcript_2406:66-1547(-)